MRQVPRKFKYLIGGDGRVARHFSYYFDLINIPYFKWNRTQKRDELCKKSSSATHILLSIPDKEIEVFTKKNPFLRKKILVHFSGALEIEGISSAHPLMQFTNRLYSLDVYKSIPFVLTKGSLFKKLLPQLTNPHYHIDSSQKPYYHAMCVMAGNFTTILWKKLRDEFKRLKLPFEAALPYLNEVHRDISLGNSNGLTGPIARGDRITINKNIESLKGDQFLNIYSAFVETFKKEAYEDRGF